MQDQDLIANLGIRTCFETILQLIISYYHNFGRQCYIILGWILVCSYNPYSVEVF